MNDAAVLEPEVALQHPAPVHTEALALLSPQPTVAEILGQHLSHDQQKKIAVGNLSNIKFLIAPHGTSAISAGTLKNDEQRQIVEQSLTTILGNGVDDAPHLPEKEGMASALGLSSTGEFVKIEGKGTIKMLAEAGVKDFADTLDISLTSHRARVR